MTKITSKYAVVDQSCFNADANLVHNLRLKDFEMAMQDVYDFFRDTNEFLAGKDLSRLDDTLRPATMSGMLSDMLTDSLAKHSRGLARNSYHNGHPDLLVKGRYANDSAQAGEHGVEIKATRKRGGVVDTHGGRNQVMCVFCYEVDNVTEPAINREPMRFTEIYLSEVKAEDFRRNERGDLGTRTSSLHRDGARKLRENWIYKTPLSDLEITKAAAKSALVKKGKIKKKVPVS